MEVVIERLDDFGRGIAYIDDKICFVENALVGEKVDIKIISEHSKFLEAKVLKYIDKSQDRIEVKCPYYDICGGCNLCHLKYKEENKFKLEKVKNVFKKFSNIDIDITDIKSSNEYNYRNKIILHGDNKSLGLYSNKTHNIVDIKSCLLCSSTINQIIKKIRKIGISGIKNVLIRVSNDDKNSILNISGDIDINKYNNISNVLIYNGKLISNDSSIISNIGEKKYYLSTNSFFQVNRLLVDDLYKEVKDNIIGTKILDLYCGTGSIGIYIDSNNITGIDNNTSNIHDANRNLELNNISGEFYLADVEDIIDRFDNFDTVIVDPPRSGLDKETISNLMRINSKRIIYVSCEPITLVRDLALMTDKYEVSKVKVFNMFPRTYHCESVTILCRKTIEK
ncbi:MAG: class I SAM-dependent RNA methyltransferase [Bacilli bacterium]|nr:class I SAM-dependent RNA methyltransferase [Bacilli bacterium]